MVKVGLIEKLTCEQRNDGGDTVQRLEEGHPRQKEGKAKNWGRRNDTRAERPKWGSEGSISVAGTCVCVCAHAYMCTKNNVMY